ncbi:DHA2 family efflux MFS transporter permease subunit [Catellatospora vulcania]|uniref:DHA2 family efflux MFS transporter permease subunit n=1 Tax=Catellatospora vulcania TaxID=1460450 RepID=UPI0012D47C98|nr:DHA2 family efflux MFS transporter permease subunit [Catellatospora vulcania]
MSNVRRWWALGALVLSVLVVGLDGTVLNVALPTIAADLDAGTDGLQWVVNAYVLVFAGLMLPFGALGDRYGRRRLILAGLAVLGAASLISVFADGLAALLVARTLMGAGAAMLTPTAIAVLPALFAPAERPKAVAVLMLGLGLGIPLGPIVGGYLLDHFWWGSIFLINVPVAALGMLAVALLMPENRDPRPRPADLPGGLLSTTGLVTLVYGIVAAPERGWGDPLVVAALAGGVLLLTAFGWWERRTADPMIDLRLFGDPGFLWGAVAATILSFGLFGLLFVVPQYLSFGFGYDALGTGVRLLPLIGGLFVASPLAARLSVRIGHRLPVTAGLLITAAGLALGATTGPATGYGFTAAWCAIVGFGTGLALAPAMDAVLGALPPERAGSGTALTMTMRQAAGALGVALLGSLLNAVYAGRVDVTGLGSDAAGTARDSAAGAYAVAAALGRPELAASAHDAFIAGMAAVLWCCAAITVVGAVLTALLLPTRRTDPGDGGESAHELVGVA